MCEACRRRDSDTIMHHPGPPMANKVTLGWEGPARSSRGAQTPRGGAGTQPAATVQYAQAGSRGRDAVLTPRDWQQSAARVSTRIIASAVAVMAQQAQQQRPLRHRSVVRVCAMPSPWASSTVRWWRASVVLKWPFWRFDAAAAAAQLDAHGQLCSHSMPLLHTAYGRVHTFTGSRRDPMLVCDAVRSATRW